MNTSNDIPILLIDDDDCSLYCMEMVLRLEGYTHLLSLKDSGALSEKIMAVKPGIILLDLKMPFLEGETLISRILEHDPDIAIIIITCSRDIEAAVHCLKKGAFDYLSKPFGNDKLLERVENAMLYLSKRRKSHIISKSLSCPQAFSEIITHNHKMLSLFEYIETISKMAQPVLITGESGVGKELFAKAIHRSSMNSGSFIPVNIAGLEDTMFSDTLFGHAKGAFTGANEKRQGLIEQAFNGTLFLDEIGDLSVSSQVKLLRLLQENEFMPLGADYLVKTNARIIAATNQDLACLEKKEMFRKDLYYRLSAHHIHIPPLRERIEDLPLLLDHYLERISKILNKPKPRYPKELLILLETYSFPGNIRELESMIFYALSRCDSNILSLRPFKKKMRRHTNFDCSFAFAISSMSTLPTYHEWTFHLVEEALKRAKGNQGAAARVLGISRQRLNRYLKKNQYSLSSKKVRLN